MRKDFDDAIVLELRARLAALRAKPYEELARLPEANTEQTSVLGRPVTFTVLRDEHDEGKFLILVRSDKPIFLGIGTAGTTEGFWVLPNGEKRDAFGDEIAQFFG